MDGRKPESMHFRNVDATGITDSSTRSISNEINPECQWPGMNDESIVADILWLLESSMAVR
jgi:hypothetical protein